MTLTNFIFTVLATGVIIYAISLFRRGSAEVRYAKHQLEVNSPPLTDNQIQLKRRNENYSKLDHYFPEHPNCENRQRASDAICIRRYEGYKHFEKYLQSRNTFEDVFNEYPLFAMSYPNIHAIKDEIDSKVFNIATKVRICILTGDEHGLNKNTTDLINGTRIMEALMVTMSEKMRAKLPEANLLNLIDKVEFAKADGK